MSHALETINLSKRYGQTWALQNCSVKVPLGRVAALVGPNGAGKTTLLHLAVGLLRPTAGSVQVFGYAPFERPTEALPRLGFVAQNHPLYLSFTIEGLLTLGRKLNPRWDDHMARARMQKLGIPLNRRAGQLSGGQQAQVALVLALAKRPDLLLLDEPLASLDPLARREFLNTLMDAVASTNLSVLLSSHIIGDLERICNYLIILSASHVQLEGNIQEILQSHTQLIGQKKDEAAVASAHTVLEAIHTEQKTTLLVRKNNSNFDAAWKVQEASLEDIVLAYLSRQVIDRSQTSLEIQEQDGLEAVK